MGGTSPLIRRLGLLVMLGAAPAAAAPLPCVSAPTGLPPSIVLGQSFTFTVGGRNCGDATSDDGGVNVSFPGLATAGDLSRVAYSGPSFTDTIPCDVGRADCLHSKAGPYITVQHVAVEGYSSSWAAGVTKSLTLAVTPKATGIFIIRYRMSIRNPATGTYSGSPPSGSLDQQGWWYSSASVQVLAKPDIRILNVSSSSGTVYEPGRNIVVNFDATNATGSASTGSFTSEVRLSTSSSSATFDGALLGTVSHASISGGGSQPKQQTFTVPAGLAHGTYYLKVRGDSTSGVDEGSETNNVGVSSAITIGAPLPCLLDITGAPANATVGVAFSFTVSASNCGTAPSYDGGINVSFPAFNASGDVARVSVPGNAGMTDVKHCDAGRADCLYGRGTGSFITAQHVAVEGDSTNWLAGAAKSITVQVTPRTSGTFTIRYRVSMSKPPGGVSSYIGSPTSGSLDQQGWEYRASTVSVVNAPADLVPESLTSASGSVYAPGRLMAVAFTVRNQGGTGTGAFNSEARLATNATTAFDGTSLGSFSSPGLGASATEAESANLTIPASLAHGTYYLKVKVDSGSVVNEGSNEGNNVQVWGTAVVVGRAQPCALALSGWPPVSATVGTPFTFTLSAANCGDALSNDGGINASFPALSSSGDVSRVTVTHSGMTDTKACDAAWTNCLYGRNSSGFVTAQHVAVEGYSTSWSPGATKSITVTVTPKAAGTFVLRYRQSMSIPPDTDPFNYVGNPASAATTDQQSWPVLTASVNVTAVPPDPCGLSITELPQVVTLGEPITFTVSASNCGGSTSTDGALNVSFPDLSQQVDRDLVIFSSTTGLEGSKRCEGTRTNCLYTVAGSPLAVTQYLAVERFTTSWEAGETHSMRVMVTPRATGPFRIHYRQSLKTPMGYLGNPTSGSPLDQQGWSVVEKTVGVKAAEFGTTVIVHGFQTPLLSGDYGCAPRWTFELAKRIGARSVGAFEGGQVLLYNRATGVFSSNGAIDEGCAPVGAISVAGERVLVFDWASESDVDVKGYSEAAADALLSALLALETSPGSLSPLHLIGHSRGTVVIAEVAERLLALGRQVDQMTFLDAHDWGMAWKPGAPGPFTDYDANRLHDLTEESSVFDDYPANRGVHCWEGVGSCDSYYQIDGVGGAGLSGREVQGAANLNLHDLSDADMMGHSLIHTWYHLTADTRPTQFTDGADGDMKPEWEAYWYATPPTVLACPLEVERQQAFTRDHDGYFFSRLGGGSDLACPAQGVPVQQNFSWEHEGLVNGDFERGAPCYAPSGSCVTPAQIPGWEGHGGGGNGNLSFQDGSLALLLTAQTSSRTHNRFFIPHNATTLFFRTRCTANDPDDSLTVVLAGRTSTKTWTYPAYCSPGSSRTEDEPLPVELLNTAGNTLTFSLVGAGASTAARLLVDDVYLGVPTAPSAPINVTVVAIAEGRIDVGWQPTSAGAASYAIERATEADWIEIGSVVVGVNSYSDLTTPLCAQVRYRVKARNASGAYSLPSDPAEVSSLGCTAPAPPRNLMVAGTGSGYVDLSWTTDPSSDETGFVAQRRLESGGAWAEAGTASANATSLRASGLAACQGYVFRVYSHRDGVTAGFSNEITATTQGCTQTPATPTGLAAAPVTASQISLSWRDNATDEAGFVVERLFGSNWAVILQPPANTTQVVVIGLASCTSYSFRVRAQNSFGNSAYSNVATAATLGCTTVPNSPTALEAVAATSQPAVDLGWQDNSGNEMGFRVLRRQLPSGTFTIMGSVTAGVLAWTDSTVAACSDYEYQVVAFNAAGASGPSNTVAVRTAGCIACRSLTLESSPPAGGTVVARTAQNCAGGYLAGTIVTLEASPALGYRFAVWDGGGGGFSNVQVATTSFQVVDDATARAIFSLAPWHRLTVGTQGPGAGRVESSPGPIVCGSTCVADFPENSVVTLAPIPAPGSTFSGWSGDADCADGTVTMTAALSCVASFSGATPPVSSALSFYTLTPCRLFDSRTSGKLITNQSRQVQVTGACGIPAEAVAVSTNITVTQATAGGHLVIFPMDQPPPTTSTINFRPNQTRANNAIVLLATDGFGDIAILPAVPPAGSVHVIVDVNGYFASEEAIGEYLFDEGSGATAVDSSGRGNDGSLESGAAWASGQAGGGAVYFGGGGWVTLPRSLWSQAGNTVFAEAWIYLTGRSGSCSAIFRKRAHFNDWDLTIRPDGTPDVAFYVLEGGSYVGLGASGTSPIPLNTWTRVGSYFDGSRLRLFVNGIEVGASATTSGAPSWGNPDCSQGWVTGCYLTTRVGQGHDGCGNLPGKIDRIIFRDRP